MKTRYLNKQKVTFMGLGLLASLSLMSGNALAVDAVGGSAQTADVVVPGPAWTVLRKVTFRNPTQRFCTATGSADAKNPNPNVPSAAPWQYAFTVSNSPNPPANQGQERTLEFWNQVVGGGIVRDNTVKEITTTGGWMANVMADPGYFTFPGLILPSAGHTVYLLARKIGAGPNLSVLDSSLTVTCTDNALLPPIGFQVPVVLPL